MFIRAAILGIIGTWSLSTTAGKAFEEFKKKHEATERTWKELREPFGSPNQKVLSFLGTTLPDGQGAACVVGLNDVGKSLRISMARGPFTFYFPTVGLQRTVHTATDTSLHGVDDNEEIDINYARLNASQAVVAVKEGDRASHCFFDPTKGTAEPAENLMKRYLPPREDILDEHEPTVDPNAEKGDPYGLASCGGKPIRKIDLSKQFNPTRQQNDGTCYSFARTATLEAGIYRLTGKKPPPLDEEFGTCLTQVQKPWWDLKAIEARAKRAQEARDGKSYLDGESSEEILGGMQTLLNTKASAPHGSFHRFYETLKNEQAKLGSSFQAPKTPIGDLIQAAQLEQLTRHHIDLFRKQNPSNPTAGMKFQDWKVRGLPANTSSTKNAMWELVTKKVPQIFNDSLHSSLIHHKFGDPKFEDRIGSSVMDIRRDIALDEIWGKSRATECRFSNPKLREIVSKITEQLCAGIPVDIGFLLPPSTDVTLNGGKNWVALTNNSNSPSGGHAAVIQGIQFFNGRPYFMMRDSQAYGDKRTPNMSQVRMPFTDACQISSAAVYVTPADPDLRAPGAQCKFDPTKRSVDCAKIEYEKPAEGGH